MLKVNQLIGFGVRADTTPPVIGLYVTTVTDSTNASSYSFGSTAIGAADADRTVIVGVGWSAGSARTVSSVTIGGNAAKIFAQRLSSDGGMAFAMLAFPSGTTATIDVTMSGTVTSIAVSTFQTTVQGMLPFCWQPRTT